MTSLTFLDSADNEIAGTLIPFDKHRDLRRLDLSFNHIAGTVPATLLSKVEKEYFEFASLRRNFISGAIPPVLAGLYVVFQDNLIDSISLGGSIEAYGSNAILCPPKTWNSLGFRSSADKPCVDCPSAQYYGSTTCGESAVPFSSPHVAQQPFDSGEIGAEWNILENLYNALCGKKWRHKDNWLSDDISHEDEVYSDTN